MTTSHERPAPPPAPPPVSPYLTVGDARAAIDFYRRAFGATLVAEQPTPDGKKLIHAALALNGGLVMLSDDFPEMSGGVSRTPKALGGSSVTIHLDLPDVDATWKRAVEAGATVELPLGDMFWGDRYGIMTDPFGHRWSLATRKKAATQTELDAGAEKHFPAAT
ncbi:VOC family protein [Sorangium sp. So ce429]